MTKAPVGSTVGLKADPLLTGLWKGENVDHDPGYFHFLPQDDGSVLVLTVEGGKAPKEWNSFRITTAKLGASAFINATVLLSNGKPESNKPQGTIPVLYRFDRGVLTLAAMDEEKVKAAIRAGKLKGVIGKGDYGDAMITGDPKTLDKLLTTAAGLSLFAPPFYTLRKVD
ncbi:MAG: hypothetical protein JO294_13955 [Alphaproteobacteria bacterium]|nr:hypothetical protein [Alphaproteobacteria bacterium]